MKILITRHGETPWNKLEKIQGQTDIDLNEVGRKQAFETGELLKNEKIDIIISSPLKRAKETAQIINKNFNLEIIEDSRLKERYFGKNEGITKSEIKALKEINPEIEKIWNYNEDVTSFDNESMKDFCKRIYEFLDEIIEKYKDKNVLLVSHGGTSVVIKCYFMKYPLEKFVDRSKIQGLRNCEVETFILE